MEFTAGGRLEVRITAADVGKRVSVRRLTESGSPGAKFTDTVGVLTSWDDGVLHITRRAGEQRPDRGIVPGRGQGRAGRARPGAAGPPRRTRSWRGLPHAPGSRWRASGSATGSCGPRCRWTGEAAPGAADGRRVGFTRRANSVLPLGDPGLPLDEALRRVARLVRRRGLPAYIQTATGAEGTQELLCAELEARGWVREVTRGDADRRRSRRSRTAPARRRVALSREPSTRRGSAAYQRNGGAERPAGSGGADGGPSVWFATVPGDGRGERRPPRSGGASWTGAGPASRRSRWHRRGGAGAWPPP